MNAAVETIRRCADPLVGDATDYDGLIERCEKAKVVLLGEATHGTHEFYEARADITKRLIDKLGFNAVAVEADWPDSWRVNEFVTGSDGDTAAADALSGFKRFPQWMWRNSDMLDFAGWLRDRNLDVPAVSSDSILRTRIRRAWATWSIAGTKESILTSLADAGYPNASVREGTEWSLPHWWWFYMVLRPPYPWGLLGASDADKALRAAAGDAWPTHAATTDGRGRVRH
jgi:hypothetical protein